MIKEIVFHIGDAKTGTSSIQSAMQLGACQCDGVVTASQKELNATALANALTPDGDPAKYKQEFEKKARWAAETNADLGVISSEFFEWVNPDHLMNALREHLPEYAASTRVIAYARPHASRILSGYAQLSKTGHIDDSFGGFVRQAMGQPRFKYTQRFGHWQKVFGDRFILRPFMREELHGQDVVADFFHEILLGRPFSLAPVENTNETMFLEEIAGMRVVQSVLTKRNVPKFLKQSIGGAMVRELALISDRSGNKLQLDRENADRLVAYFREDVRKLDAQFFEGSPMERALTEAGATARPVVQSVQASAYFSPGEITRLRGLSGDLAKLVNSRPWAWRRSHQLRIRQIQEGDMEPLDAAQQKNAAAVWGILEQIAQILASGRVGQGTDTQEV